MADIFLITKHIISGLHIFMRNNITQDIIVDDLSKVTYTKMAGKWIQENKNVGKYSMNGYIRNNIILIPCLGIDVRKITFLFKLKLFPPRNIHMIDLTDYDNVVASPTKSNSPVSDYDRAMRGLI